VSDLTGRRTYVTDFDNGFSRWRWRSRCCRLWLFFFTASGQTGCNGYCDRCESEFIDLLHVTESSD